MNSLIWSFSNSWNNLWIFRYCILLNKLSYNSLDWSWLFDNLNIIGDLGLNARYFIDCVLSFNNFRSWCNQWSRCWFIINHSCLSFDIFRNNKWLSFSMSCFSNNMIVYSYGSFSDQNLFNAFSSNILYFLVIVYLFYYFLYFYCLIFLFGYYHFWFNKRSN